MSWEPVKDYIEKHMKVENKDGDPIYFDNYNSSALERIIHTQHKLSEYMKKNDLKKQCPKLIVIDDFADDPSFTRHSELLHALYIRGRHTFISTIAATKY